MDTTGRPAVRSSASSSDRYTALLGSDEASAERLGGKGGALARLVAAGFPVPATGVVTTTAYRAVAAEPGIEALVARIGEVDDDAPPVTADEVDAIFADTPVDGGVTTAVIDLAGAVGDGGPIAVRSSATVEDLHGSSFAGQYRSLLNIDSGDDRAIIDAVRQVWASLWHPAPTAYRRAFAIDDSDVAMAVVLMRMIPATSAGVVFTADPGGSDGARVEAVEGLGESLVSGQTTPSAWVVPRGRHEEQEPPLPAAASRALQLALDVERGFDTPQDVEWAAAGDDVYVVQARPITVLESHDGFDTDLDDHELTTAGIVEMVPGVLPSLRWEINRFLLEEAFRSVLDSLGVIRGTAAEDRPFVRRVRGRVAIDFDQLRDAAADIPGAVEELELQYFGQNDDQAGAPTDEPKTRRRSRWAGLRRDIRTLQTRRQVIEQAEVVIRSTKALRSRRPALGDWDETRLLAYARRLVDLSARGLAAELGVAASGAAAYRRLELQLGSYLGATEGQKAAQIMTAKSGMAVDRRDSASAAVFAGPTWAEIGATPPVSPPDLEGYTDTRWAELKDRLRSLPGWTRRRVLTGGVVDVRTHLVYRLISDVVHQLHRREAAKAAILELGGEVRRVHLELGRRLVERGILAEPTDIELLASAEVLAIVDGEEVVGPDAIRRRRNWLSRYEAEGNLPVRFTGVPDRTPKPLPEGDLLTGWAASPGRRQGTARVVTSSTGRLEPGEILVAEATDASWSPLFMKAGAIVVERGGPLSHAAILARELGLPAVLNVAGACRKLDRCVISVDGDQGAVVIESRGEQT